MIGCGVYIPSGDATVQTHVLSNQVLEEDTCQEEGRWKNATQGNTQKHLSVSCTTWNVLGYGWEIFSTNCRPPEPLWVLPVSELRILGISVGALPASAAGGCQQAFPRAGGCFWTWLGSQGAIPTSLAECQVAVADIFTHLIFFCLWRVVLSYSISKEMGWAVHETEGRIVLT